MHSRYLDLRAFRPRRPLPARALPSFSSDSKSECLDGNVDALAEEASDVAVSVNGIRCSGARSRLMTSGGSLRVFPLAPCEVETVELVRTELTETVDGPCLPPQSESPPPPSPPKYQQRQAPEPSCAPEELLETQTGCNHDLVQVAAAAASESRCTSTLRRGALRLSGTEGKVWIPAGPGDQAPTGGLAEATCRVYLRYAILPKQRL